MSTNYADCEAYLNRFASRVNQRVIAAGISDVGIEDIRQECWVAWCTARDVFSENLGVPFKAYLRICMGRHINGWLRSFERNNDAVATSLNRTIDEESGDEFGDIFAGDAEEQEDFLRRDRVLAMLSERARQFVELMTNPPLDLYRQVDRVQDRVLFARERGIPTAAPRSLTSALVMDLMGCTRYERRAILNELQTVSVDINKC